MKQINLFRWTSTFPCKVIANHASISHDSGICGDFSRGGLSCSGLQILFQQDVDTHVILFLVHLKELSRRRQSISCTRERCRTGRCRSVESIKRRPALWKALQRFKILGQEKGIGCVAAPAQTKATGMRRDAPQKA